MLKPKRLNQRTIAKATGVSRATVSLVLRGGEGAAEETRIKVLEAAKRMGYRPNALVRTIRSGKSRSVGVMVPPHDSFWQRVCYGIHDRLVEADHLPLFVWDSEQHTEPQEAYALKQIHRLLDRWVDGVILWPQFADYYAKHLHEFERRNIPVVIIDHYVPGLKADTVCSDEDQIARLVIEHLDSLGHRKVLIVSGPENIGWADNRCAALDSEISKRGEMCASTIRLVSLKPKHDPDITACIVEALRREPAITAIVAASDHIAQRCYDAAQQLKLSIPGDISVTGVGDMNYGPAMSPPLTTVRQDGYSVGRQAAQIELERGAGILGGPPTTFQVGVELVIRGSTTARRG